MKPISEAYHESKETPSEERWEHKTGKEARPPRRKSKRHGKRKGRRKGGR